MPKTKIGDVQPLTVEQIRERVQAAKDRRSEKQRQIADEIGALPSSRIAVAYARGQVDRDSAELMSWKCAYRHEYTDYDEVIRATKDKSTARGEATDAPIPDDWSTYLDHYDFAGPEAEALAKTLQDPSQCHPIWFREAMIAVRRSRLPLDELTYESVCTAITRWREEREVE